MSVTTSLYEDGIISILDKMREAGLADDARYLANVFMHILPLVSAFYFHLARDKVTGAQYNDLAQRAAEWNNRAHKT